MTRRRTDRVRVLLLTGAAIIAGVWPVLHLLAQTQDYINGSVAQQLSALGQRIDKIDQMINAVLVALVINVIAQVLQIRRAPDRRERWK